MAYNYLITNIFVQSDLPLDGVAVAANSPHLQPEVVIRTFESSHPNAPKQIISSSGFSFSTVDGLAFTVSEGNRISIFKEDRVTHTEIMLFLLGSAWGVLCHQRGLFPLHCSTVSVDDHAFAFVAESGGGKSTLAASLCSSEVRHVCDDVAIVQSDAAAWVPIHAMPKGLKLWREAIDALGLVRSRLALVEGGREKHYVEPPRGPDRSVLDLAGIYDICFSDEAAPPRIEPLTGIEAVKTVYRNVYRGEWLGLLGVSDQVLIKSRRIAAQVPVYRFTRPRSLDRIAEGSALLVDHMNNIRQASS